MPFDTALLMKLLLKAGFVVIIANEIRGIILAAPVFYGIYQAGGTIAAVWLGACSLGGIALSVIIPGLALKKFGKKAVRAQS